MSSRIELDPVSVITWEQANRIRNHAERIVTVSVIIAGLLPTPAGSIRIDKPVALPDGRFKTVYHWDLTVSHPEDPTLSYFVEVGNGNAKTPAKLAQLEVVRRAGIENHMLITADIWTFLEENLTDHKLITTAWKGLIGWTWK